MRKTLSSLVLVLMLMVLTNGAVEATENVMVGATGYNSIALKSDGTVWTWGWNDFGQLGNGSTNDSSVPLQVSGLSNVAGIAQGFEHTVALKSDGTVWTWGRNNLGQLGDGTNSDRYNPVQVTGLSNIVSVSAGAYHTIALDSDGTVWTWGRNASGQLGDGTLTDSTSPIHVSGISNVVSVSGGENLFTVALDSGGNVWGWGNYYQPTPVQVSGLSNVVSVDGGAYHTIAVKDDGTVWTWGYNDHGQLGDDTQTQRTTPAQVSGLSNVVSVAGGWEHTIALTSDGIVWSWGYNGHGELGIDNTTDQYLPVQVSGLSNVVSVNAGAYHTIAVKDDGTFWALGGNFLGQLGIGNATGPEICNEYACASTPVQVTDITTPTGTVAIINTTYYSGSTYYGNLALTCSDFVGCTHMKFSHDNSTWYGWENISTARTVTFTDSGTNPIYVKFKDAAGNISDVYSASVSLPVITGTILINNGDASTSSDYGTFTLSCSSNLGTCTNMRFSNDQSYWYAWETYSTTRSCSTSPAGTVYKYVQYKDSAGNTSPVYYDTIVRN